jgi:hypothetical protein
MHRSKEEGCHNKKHSDHEIENAKGVKVIYFIYHLPSITSGYNYTFDSSNGDTRVRYSELRRLSSPYFSSSRKCVHVWYCTSIYSSGVQLCEKCNHILGPIHMDIKSTKGIVVISFVVVLNKPWRFYLLPLLLRSCHGAKACCSIFVCVSVGHTSFSDKGILRQLPYYAWKGNVPLGNFYKCFGD